MTVAGRAVFLLSDYARAVTGAHLDVNGGEMLWALSRRRRFSKMH